MFQELAQLAETFKTNAPEGLAYLRRFVEAQERIATALEKIAGNTTKGARKS